MSDPRTVLTDPVHFLAFGFGAGLTPHLPGSAGTLVAIPVYLLLMPVGPVVYTIVVLSIFVAGIWICGESAGRLGIHDHPGIVWDEIAGFLLTLLPLKLWPGQFQSVALWYWLFIAYTLFRVMDIAKPFPIRLLDARVHGGFGIMADDALAAVYAVIILLVISRLVVS